MDPDPHLEKLLDPDPQKLIRIHSRARIACVPGIDMLCGLMLLCGFLFRVKLIN